MQTKLQRMKQELLKVKISDGPLVVSSELRDSLVELIDYIEEKFQKNEQEIFKLKYKNEDD